MQHFSFRWIEQHRPILDIAQLESPFLPVTLYRADPIQHAQKAENGPVYCVLHDSKENLFLSIV